MIRPPNAMGPRLRQQREPARPAGMPDHPFVKEGARKSKCYEFKKLFRGSTLNFVLRTLVLNAISLASLVKLVMRFLTVFLVIMHYQFGENVDFYSQGLR